MRKLKFILFLLPMLFLWGCAGENVPKEITGEVLHEVELTFNIGVDSSVDTKATESFDKTDCLQHVTDLRIYVFRSVDGEEEPFTLCNLSAEEDVEQLYFKVDAFNGNSTEADKIEEHVYKIPAKLKEGHYRFLAVGRDDEPETSDLKLNWIAGETKWDEAVMTNTKTDRAWVSELFTGFAAIDKKTPLDVKVEGAGGFLIDITLRRAVAGVFLYVENIPEKYKAAFASTDGKVKKGDELGVKEVAIVSAGHEQLLNLVNRSRGDNFNKATAEEFGFRKIATVSPQGLAKDGYYEERVCEGRYMFPADLVSHTLPSDYFEKEEDRSSLALCLLTEVDGKQYPLTIKPIQMGRTEDVHPDDNSVDTTDPGATARKYSLFANHLYCLGNKNEEDGTDKPIDLKEALDHPELQIIVIGSWQAIVDIEMK